MKPRWLTPIALPPEWQHSIDPIRRPSDGRILKRFRLLDPESGPIYVESQVDLLFDCKQVEPMAVPQSMPFYLDWKPLEE